MHGENIGRAQTPTLTSSIGSYFLPIFIPEKDQWRLTASIRQRLNQRDGTRAAAEVEEEQKEESVTSTAESASLLVKTW